MAFAELHGVNITNFSFTEFRSQFPFFSTRRWCTYVPTWNPPKAGKERIILARIGALLGRIPTVRFWGERDIVFDGENESDPRVAVMRSASSVIFEGWKFRSRTIIQQIMPQIREVFSPRVELAEMANLRLIEARQRGDIVVGVHVRWEDYRGTPYFFTLPEFGRELSKIESFFAPAKVAFIICSPERLDPSLFSNNCVVVLPESVVADLCTLAACDYILGPPSTFSGWASFYGGKPLFTMQHVKGVSDIGQAEIVRW